MIRTRGKWLVQLFPAFLSFVLLCLCFSFVFAQSTSSELNTIRIRGMGSVDRKGSLHLDLDWKIPTNALYLEIRRNFPNAYLILREFASQRALRIEGDFLGAATNKQARWTIDLGEGTDCLWIEDQMAIFLQIIPTDSELLQVMDVIMNLPRKPLISSITKERGY